MSRDDLHLVYDLMEDARHRTKNWRNEAYDDVREDLRDAWGAVTHLAKQAGVYRTKPKKAKPNQKSDDDGVTAIMPVAKKAKRDRSAEADVPVEPVADQTGCVPAPESWRREWTCPNCGHDQRDEEGDACGKCFEPVTK